MRRIITLISGGLLLSTTLAYAQTMVVVTTAIDSAIAIAKIINRVVQNGKDEHFDTRAYITTHDHYTDDISYSYDGSAGDNIIGYLIEDVSEKPSKDGYLRVNNVTVSTANGNPFG
ncbi:MAG: hypothetical protein J6B07_01840, partial [Opitutales bacterium]|nr:hypothetical protein [Opitutales bacterium]